MSAIFDVKGAEMHENPPRTFTNYLSLPLVYIIYSREYSSYGKPNVEVF